MHHRYSQLSVTVQLPVIKSHIQKCYFKNTLFNLDHSALMAFTPLGTTGSRNIPPIEKNSQETRLGLTFVFLFYIIYTIKIFQANPYSWMPTTLLMLLALFTHTGIKMLPWILIGEVSRYISILIYFTKLFNYMFDSSKLRNVIKCKNIIIL